MSVEYMATKFQYTAVIRTNKVDDILLRVVAALREQSVPPEEILFVDSSGSEDVHASLSKIGRAVKYQGPFNFSRAVNLGVSKVGTGLTLMISSHTVPSTPRLIEDGWDEAQKVGARIIYWSPPSPDAPNPRRIDIVDRYSYNGRNGLSNSFGMFETAEAVAFPFREDVFASEDQEWAKRYLERHPDAKIVGVISPDILYLNPGYGDSAAGIAKYVQAEVAHLLFTARRSAIAPQIAGRIARSMLALSRGRISRARAHVEIVARYLWLSWKGSSA
ncbi:glycosyltransferase family 2 protein [Sphingobium chlorophenolicum]|nr:hypothetical protein [Sphingobium chlorophenolicum]